MFQLVYCSTAVSLFAVEELNTLLAQSRDRNAREGITGLLLYHEGGFVQALEGAEAKVRNVFVSILRDRRHHRIVTVFEETVAEREFAGWHMAFRRINDRGEIPDGFSDLDAASIDNAF